MHEWNCKGKHQGQRIEISIEKKIEYEEVSLQKKSATEYVEIEKCTSKLMLSIFLLQDKCSERLFV